MKLRILLLLVIQCLIVCILFTTKSTAQGIQLGVQKNSDSISVVLPLDKALPFRLKYDGYSFDVYSPFQSEMNKKMEEARKEADREVWELYSAIDALERNNDFLQDEYERWVARADSLKVLYEEEVELRAKERSLIIEERDDAREKLRVATYKSGWNAFWDGVWGIKPLGWMGIDFNLGSVKEAVLVFLATYGLTAIIEGR